MKLAMAAEIFPPDIGGPATYSKILAEYLLKQGWTVKVICYSDKKIEDNYAASIGRSQNVFWRYFKYFFALKRLAKDADLIYAMGPVSSGLPAIVIKKLTGKKAIIKVTGDYAWEQARNLKKTDIGLDEFQKKQWAGKIGLLKKIETWVCQNADKIITPSEYLKRIVMGWGIKENKIEVIYNAETLAYQPPAEAPRNHLISVGRLVPWKGFELLISLMPEISAIEPNFFLEIFGAGPQKENLLELVKKFGLENRVRIEKVSHDELMLKLANAEIFILNTGYEGLSHAILEAMAAGTPVIATNIGGNPELIKNDYNGLLVEYNNKEQLKEAILKLHNNPELRQEFITNAKEVLKKFTFKEMINKTINVFKIINN